MTALSRIINTDYKLLVAFGLEQPRNSTPSPSMGKVEVLPSKKEIILLIKQQKLDKAISILDPLCETPKSDVDFLALRAAAYIKKSILLPALIDIEKALSIMPNEPRLLKVSETLKKKLFSSEPPPAKIQKTQK